MTLLIDQSPAATITSRGIIGDRQLVAVQTFDIARLTSHPVALVPGSFIAVTGRGPRDSNESGKTSFNASASLLLGDPEWRVLGGGVANVAQLLFEPDTAGVTSARIPAAQYGFIVGVFAAPDDVEATAHTVWLRIASTPKYLSVRHAPGVHLVIAESDREQHRLAPQAWSALPAADELGPQGYVDALYGRSPRCLAYVAARGKQRSGPSLLKMDTGAFRPEEIGAALIRLTGRSEALETELEQRRRFAAQVAELGETEVGHQQLRQQEERELDGIRIRAKVGAHLRDGVELWRKHLARGLLDSLAQRDERAAQLAEAERAEGEHAGVLRLAQREETCLADDKAVRDARDEARDAHEEVKDQLEDAQATERDLVLRVGQWRNRLQELEQVGALEARMTVADARAVREEARQRTADARVELRRAAAYVSTLEDDLHRAEMGAGGDAGASVELLQAEEIDVVGLLDTVEIDPAHRGVWEARLHPWRAAVCVPGDRLTDALTACRTNSGAVLVTGTGAEDQPLPEGIVAAPALARQVLTVLRDAAVPVTTAELEAADYQALGIAVLGGFAEPTTGRANIVAGLRARLGTANRQHQAAERQLGLASETETQADTDVAAAEAAAEHATLSGKVDQVERDLLPPARKRVAELETAESIARQALIAREIELHGIETARESARRKRQAAEAELTRLAVDRGRAQSALDAVHVDYWAAAFAGSDADARVALNWDPAAWPNDGAEITADDPDRPVERRGQDTLGMKANECLVQIIAELGIERDTGANAPTPGIAEAVRRRESLTNESGATLAREDVAFHVIADAIQEWLTPYADRDQYAAEQIEAARQDRQQEIEFSTEKINGLRTSLDTIQDSLEQRIESNLSAISTALDRLNRDADGYGADLDWTVQRPVGPDGMWIWRVVPRWRRSPGGRMLPYDNATNSAQEKLFSVHLVLAALLASPHPQGRVLILDELGDSLGDEHRRDVLRAVADVAREHQITVLGTCQDGVMPDAASYCGEILYFNYPSKAEALNLPTRMFGFDENSQRVELTTEALIVSRPMP